MLIELALGKRDLHRDDRKWINPRSSVSALALGLTHGLREFLLGDSRSEPSLSASGCRSCPRRSQRRTTPRLFELAKAWFSSCKGFFCFRERVPRRGNPRPLQRRANGASEPSKNSCRPCVNIERQSRYRRSRITPSRSGRIVWRVRSGRSGRSCRRCNRRRGGRRGLPRGSRAPATEAGPWGC